MPKISVMISVLAVAAIALAVWRINMARSPAAANAAAFLGGAGTCVLLVCLLMFWLG